MSSSTEVDNSTYYVPEQGWYPVFLAFGLMLMVTGLAGFLNEIKNGGAGGWTQSLVGFAFVSFGSVMLATRLDSVGEAAALRETSVIFAAIFGWLFLKEKVGPIRGGLMVLIAAGAVLVEFG